MILLMAPGERLARLLDFDLRSSRMGTARDEPDKQARPGRVPNLAGRPDYSVARRGK